MNFHIVKSFRFFHYTTNRQSLVIYLTNFLSSVKIKEEKLQQIPNKHDFIRHNKLKKHNIFADNFVLLEKFF